MTTLTGALVSFITKLNNNDKAIKVIHWFVCVCLWINAKVLMTGVQM